MRQTKKLQIVVIGQIIIKKDWLGVYFQRWSPRGRPWPRGRPRGHILKSLALALASKPQVLGLGLGLEALGPRKLPCPRLEDSTIFEPLKFC